MKLITLITLLITFSLVALLSHNKKRIKTIRSANAQTFLYLRSIAYMADLSYKAGYPEKFKKLQEISLENGWVVLKPIYNYENNAGAAVAIRTDENKILVSIKGTDGLYNILDDVTALKDELNDENAPVGTSVHVGFKFYLNTLLTFDAEDQRDLLDVFNQAVLQLWQRQIDKTQKNKKNKVFECKFIITGHSLGGAAATLFAHYLLRNYKNFSSFKTIAESKWDFNIALGDIDLITFGSPRVGNDKFGTYLESLLGKNHIYTVQYMSDPITTVPPESLGFKHLGTIYQCFEPSEDRQGKKSCSIVKNNEISSKDQKVLDERKGKWYELWKKFTLGDHSISGSYIYIGLDKDEYEKRIEKKKEEKSKVGILSKAFNAVNGAINFVSGKKLRKLRK